MRGCCLHFRCPKTPLYDFLHPPAAKQPKTIANTNGFYHHNHVSTIFAPRIQNLGICSAVCNSCAKILVCALFLHAPNIDKTHTILQKPCIIQKKVTPSKHTKTKSFLLAKSQGYKFCICLRNHRLATTSPTPRRTSLALPYRIIHSRNHVDDNE